MIVIDDVSGLADESKKFARFLTFARNFNCSCVYIFHMNYPEKTIWKKVLSLMNILNIFPASVSLASVRKILESVCIKKTRKHIPLSALRIGRLFIELANRNDRVYLALIMTDLGDLGQKQINLIFKRVILLLMMNRFITSLLADK